MLMILYWTWCLPQTFLGFLIFLIIKIIDPAASSFFYKKGIILTRTIILNGGLSLGFFVFSFDYSRYPGKFLSGAQKRMDAHEWGHSIQSLIFGPAYLLVIGFPSIIRSYHWRRNNNIEGYYSAFPENWADKIGCVKR
jgi:hypothetical protein